MARAKRVDFFIVGFGRPDLLWHQKRLFEKYFQLATALLKAGLIWPALEHTLKCSHLFNILDSSNSIGVTERTAFILRIRQLAIGVAKTYVEGSAASAGAAGAGHAEASAPGREA